MNSFLGPPAERVDRSCEIPSHRMRLSQARYAGNSDARRVNWKSGSTACLAEIKSQWPEQ